MSKIHDDLLRAETELDTITAVFQCQSYIPINRIVPDVLWESSYFYLILFGVSVAFLSFFSVETHRNSYTYFTSVVSVGFADLSARKSNATKFRKSKFALMNCYSPVELVLRRPFDDLQRLDSKFAVVWVNFGHPDDCQ